MALITCKDCGNQVSDRAQFCPRCGAPVEIENVSGTGTSSHEADEKNCKANEGGVIMVLCLVVILTCQGNHDTTRR